MPIVAESVRLGQLPRHPGGPVILPRGPSALSLPGPRCRSGGCHWRTTRFSWLYGSIGGLRAGACLYPPGPALPADTLAAGPGALRSRSAGWRPSPSRAVHLALPELHLDVGDALGRANTGNKLMTLVASALAGADCIDDTDGDGEAFCAPAGRPALPAACSRRHPPWGPSCPAPVKPAPFARSASADGRAGG